MNTFSVYPTEGRFQTITNMNHSIATESKLVVVIGSYSRIHNTVVQPGCCRPKDFLVLEVKMIEIILQPIKFIFFLLRRNGFFIQLPVVTFDYIP